MISYPIQFTPTALHHHRRILQGEWCFWRLSLGAFDYEAKIDHETILTHETHLYPPRDNLRSIKFANLFVAQNIEN